MKHAFIVELDVDSDTDFTGIAEELKDSIDEHFSLACLSVKPWAAGRAVALPIDTPAPAAQSLPPLPPPNFQL